MAKTARQIITASLRKLGVIASGETPGSEDLQDGLSALQGLIDSWSAIDLLSYVETKETFTLTPGKQEYTIGSSGDFDTGRPIEILGLSVLEAGGPEIHLEHLKFEQWYGASRANATSSLPYEFYFETAWPLAKLKLYPVPSEAKQIVIYSRKPFSSVSTVNASVDLPHGYEDAVVYNLALELADEYGAEVSPLIVKKADDALAMIKARNLAANIPYAKTEGALQGCGASRILKGS